MFSFLFKKFSGRHYRKFLEKCRPIVARINEIELTYQALTDEQLRAKTDEFRARIAATTDKKAALAELLPEAFATVKNAARRMKGRKVVVCEHELTWDMVHFDVQLIGGMAIHEGKIAEMATGEGKTLVSTLPLYLNTLTGRNTQLVTVNDYLARRDSEWMGHLYSFLGVSVGCIQQQMSPDLRREMYGRDITYGTASEFGFDYLRDNGMATRKEDQVQRDHWFCIVDEIDSILVDEARTPLIISGPAPIEREQPFTRIKPPIEKLVNDQTRLCNRLVSEAMALLEKPTPTAEDRDQAARKMLQVKMGGPNNKQLLRLLETPDYRKLLDKVETDLNSDLNKAELPRQRRPALRRRRAPASGRLDRDRSQTASPRQRRRVRAPRPRHRVLRPRKRSDRPRATRSQEARRPDALRRDLRGDPRHFPAPARLLALRKGRRIRRPRGQGHDRRREHRPRHARPPLVRRAAPGR
jgi:preprotein translocase subunit SecA